MTSINILTQYNEHLSSKINNLDREELTNILDEFMKEYNKTKKETKSKKRPRGRTPKGKVWNEHLGEWDDINGSTTIQNNLPTKLSELRKLAKEKGISETELDIIDDSDNPSSKFMDFLNKFNIEDNNINTEGNDINLDIVNELDSDSTVLYQGVQYVLDSDTNELSDPDNYDIVGIWKKNYIDFHDGMEEKHTNHDDYCV